MLPTHLEAIAGLRADLPVGVSQHAHEPIQQLRQVRQHAQAGHAVQHRHLTTAHTHTAQHSTEVCMAHGMLYCSARDAVLQAMLYCRQCSHASQQALCTDIMT